VPKFRYPEVIVDPLLVAEPDTVGAYEAKTHLPRLLDEVSNGKSFVITKRGRPVARLIPLEPKPEISKIISAFREFRGDLPSASLTPEEIKAMIEEGRR